MEELYYQAWTPCGGRTFFIIYPNQVIYCFETIELFAIKTHCVIRKSAKRWQHISQYTNPPKGGSTWASVSKPCRLKGQMYRSLRSLEIPIPSQTFTLTSRSGESANAVPHYQKLCNRDSHIWGIRMGVSAAAVQWPCLTMGELPSWPQCRPCQVSMTWRGRMSHANLAKFRDDSRYGSRPPDLISIIHGTVRLPLCGPSVAQHDDVHLAL